MERQFLCTFLKLFLFFALRFGLRLNQGKVYQSFSWFCPRSKFTGSAALSQPAPWSARWTKTLTDCYDWLFWLASDWHTDMARHLAVRRRHNSINRRLNSMLTIDQCRRTIPLSTGRLTRRCSSLHSTLFDDVVIWSVGAAFDRAPTRGTRQFNVCGTPQALQMLIL